MAWVLTIAHHALVDHVRRRRPEALGPAADGAATPPSDDPLERLIRAERADAARALLARLAPDLRRMAELRYDMDLSHAEIAAVLEISEDAVKQRFSRMHRRLRVALAKEGGTHDV